MRSSEANVRNWIHGDHALLLGRMVYDLFHVYFFLVELSTPSFPQDESAVSKGSTHLSLGARLTFRHRRSDHDRHSRTASIPHTMIPHTISASLTSTAIRYS